MKRISLIAAVALFIGLTAFALSGELFTKATCKAAEHNENGKDTMRFKEWYSINLVPDAGPSKELRYQVYAKRERMVKEERLHNAKVLADFIDGYPLNWIFQYSSVEIIANCNGSQLKAVSANDTLTTEQKSILNKVDIGSDIVIDGTYYYVNEATTAVEKRFIHIRITLVPERDAEYAGGYPEMASYLKEKVINRVAAVTAKEVPAGVVLFTVNEEGDIENTRISVTSGNPIADKLFIEGINNMPQWKPAVNAKGENVKQEFEFNVGRGGC